MKVLVTGGTGYIGSHTAVALIEAGHEVVIVDDLSNSKADVVDKIAKITGKKPWFYHIDMKDKALLETVFKEHQLDATIHFAGYKAVGESVEKPLMYYHNNILITLHLLELMAQYQVNKIIFSSSATVYGNPSVVPITEDEPVKTTNPYGATKVMIESILADCCHANPQLSVVSLRYFNPIGAHKSGLIGEVPNGIPNNLLPYIAQVATGQREYLRVWGNDYPTVDGTGVRDYIHVVDLALGHVKALEYASQLQGIDYINLGTGNGYSVLEVKNAFEKATGKTIPYKIMPRRPGDIATCYADTTKALKVLGWKAQYEINQMCVDLWRFYSNNSE